MWVANYNPPLMSYFLAGVASLFGWSEIVLHLACLVVAFLAALGIYSLAQMWCQRPLLATVVAIFTPAFLVSSTTLMCDVMMLGFWIWAIVLWERALGSRAKPVAIRRSWSTGGFGGTDQIQRNHLAAPVADSEHSSEPASWGGGCWDSRCQLFMLAGYELITARMYGKGLFFAAVHYAQTVHIGFPGGWKASGIIGLAFAGGSLLPLLFFAPLLWRRRVLLAGGIVILGALLLTFRLCNNLGLMCMAPDLDPMKRWDFLIQAVLLTAGGLHLLLLVVAETWRRRDAVTITLALWTIGVICFATVLNWTVNVRSFLPVVPAAAILLVRRLEAARGNSVADGWLLWPLIPAAAITLSIVIADYQLANSARTAAEQITLKYKSTSHQLWFEGHGAFQYYMEKLGGLPIDVERSLLQPDDTVVVPVIGIYTILPPGSVGWVEDLQYAPSSWMNLMGRTENGAAGFYGANWGPVPFTIGKLPFQDYYVVKVFSRVQYNTQPANLRGVQAGDVPSFSSLSFRAENTVTFTSQPEVMNQARLAAQLKTEGKIEEAIQQYRNALSMDSNNPVVLNNLARILATADKPELRNGKEAVQLATKAVILTYGTQPTIIGTLAAAYAQAGQFPQACEMAQSARALAWITGQKEIAANYLKLLSLYSSGKTASARETGDGSRGASH